MRISAKAEYACTAMLELAASWGDPQPLRIQTIADAHGISARFLVQILLQLKKAGLVASVRGAAGGYQLAREPQNITLAQIINGIEDRTLASHKIESALEKVTRTPAVQVLLSVWQDIQQQEQRTLENLTLAELLRRAQQNNALVYQI